MDINKFIYHSIQEYVETIHDSDIAKSDNTFYFCDASTFKEKTTKLQRNLPVHHEDKGFERRVYA
jgi:hypothetical protein